MSLFDVTSRDDGLACRQRHSPAAGPAARPMPRPAAAPSSAPDPIDPCRLAAALAMMASGIAAEDLLARRRAPAAAKARHLAMYLAHVGLGVSQADVARAFGRDRSTVGYACRRIEDLREGPFDVHVSRLESCARWAAGT